MRIELISDTHLEHENSIPIESAGDVLVLAGDIGTLDSDHSLFINGCAELYKHIVVILGNHEYWSAKSYDHKLKQAEAIYSKIPNVHFLDRGYVDLMGVRFLGCTMWTHVSPEHSFVVEEYMNDYKRIRVKKNGRKYKLTCNDVQEWHRRDRSWLESQIEASDLPVVVVTHHSPLFDVKPRPLDYAYHSDLTGMMNSKVKLWCHGHTHRYRKVPVGETTVWCNPFGYPDEKTGFISGDTFEI